MDRQWGKNTRLSNPARSSSIEGMVCTKIKPGEIKLQDPDGQGIVVRVELAAENHLPQGLGPGSRISTRKARWCLIGATGWRRSFAGLSPASGRTWTLIPSPCRAYLAYTPIP